MAAGRLCCHAGRIGLHWIRGTWTRRALLQLPPPSVQACHLSLPPGGGAPACMMLINNRAGRVSEGCIDLLLAGLQICLSAPVRAGVLWTMGHHVVACNDFSLESSSTAPQSCLPDNPMLVWACIFPTCQPTLAGMPSRISSSAKEELLAGPERYAGHILGSVVQGSTSLRSRDQIKADPHLCRRVDRPSTPQMGRCQRDEVRRPKPADESCLRVIHLACMQSHLQRNLPPVINPLYSQLPCKVCLRVSCTNTQKGKVTHPEHSAR